MVCLCPVKSVTTRTGFKCTWTSSKNRVSSASPTPGYSPHPSFPFWHGMCSGSGSVPRCFIRTKTVTHPGTNRVWRRATTLIENDALVLRQSDTTKIRENQDSGYVTYVFHVLKDTHLC